MPKFMNQHSDEIGQEKKDELHNEAYLIAGCRHAANISGFGYASISRSTRPRIPACLSFIRAAARSSRSSYPFRCRIPWMI